MKHDLRILMLEDDPLDADLNKVQLSLIEEYNFIVHWVSDGPSFIKAIASFNPEIILSDYNLPNYTGIQALKDLQQLGLLIPFIFVTGALNEEVAAQTIKAGAWDYVMKDRLFRLPHAIRGAIQLKDEKLKNLHVQEQNLKLSMAVEQSPSHIIITDIGGNIEYVNVRFCMVTGYSREETIGSRSSILKSGHHSPDFYNNLWNTISSGNIWRGEFLNKKRDGSLFWESASISPLKNSENVITHFIAVKEDITERKNLEKELIKARDLAERANQLKTTFLQNLSHEICTPLNAIVGFSSMLNDIDGNKESKKEYIDIILKSSNQLLAVINDILTVSRIQTGQQEISNNPFSLNKALNEMFLIFNPKALDKKLLLITQTILADDEDIIISDERVLCEILSNLLSNAIKFTNQGTIEFGYKLKKEFVEFFVKDTGIGINEDKKEEIFERFSQADLKTSYEYGGIGLGLSISKSYVEMLGGQINVISEPNFGSTFSFSIPYKNGNQTNIDLSDQKQKNGIESKKILVVEDEFFNFVLIKEILKKTPFEVIHATNGIEALDISRKNADIKLILMDIKMPEMDGITALHKIREYNSKIPIIAQTAYAMEDEKLQFLNEGFNDYIPKPINKKKLLELIEVYLGATA